VRERGEGARRRGWRRGVRCWAGRWAAARAGAASRRRPTCSVSSAGSRWWLISTAAAMCMTVGKVSLELWPLFTWSLGCTSLLPRSPPRISMARLAITCGGRRQAMVRGWAVDCAGLAGKQPSCLEVAGSGRAHRLQLRAATARRARGLAAAPAPPARRLLRPAAAREPRRAVRPLGRRCTHLVGVHVALRARARLPHHQREVVHQLAVRHLCGGLHDGVADLAVQHALLHVDLRAARGRRSVGWRPGTWRRPAGRPGCSWQAGAIRRRLGAGARRPEGAAGAGAGAAARAPWQRRA
jgi:hypothetical protein